MLGAAAGLTGDRAKGRQFYAESVELHRRMADPVRLAGAIGNFGLLERQDGDFSRATELLDECLILSRAYGSELDIVWALKELAMTTIAVGSISEACEYLREGFERAGRFNLSILEIDLVFAAAVLASTKGSPGDAALLLGAVSAIWERSGTEILPTIDWTVTEERARTAIGEAKFDARFADGRSLDRDAAVRHAISCLD